MKKRQLQYYNSKAVHNLDLDTSCKSEQTVISDTSMFMQQPLCHQPVTRKDSISKEKKKSLIHKLKKFSKHLQNKCYSSKKGTTQHTTLAIL